MKKSAINTFIWMFNITFYIFVACAFIIVAVEASRWFRPDYSATYYIGSIDSNAVEGHVPEKHDLHSTNPHIEKPYLATNEWKVAFEAKDLSVKLFMSVFKFLRVLYLLAILILLRSFVLSLKINESFTLVNIKRLERLGILLILIEPLLLLATTIRTQFVTDHLDIQFVEHSLGYRLGYALGAADFVWNWIFTGLLVIIIAGVFKQGLKLKEEVDLTV